MNTNIFSYPIIQFFDDNGDPLSGGMVYSYAAGTTTPQPVYTDAGGQTAQANPIVLDGAGRAQVWLDAAKSYRIVVQDSNGTVIPGLCADNISSPNVTSTTYVSSGSSSTGSTASTVTNGFINVMDYIPEAERININTDDMVSYFTTAATAAFNNNKALYIPNGTYYLGSAPTLNVPVAFAPSAVLRVPTATLVINPIITDPQKHFALTNNQQVHITTSKSTPVDILPEWFGALGDGSTNDSNAINQAINSCGDGQRVVFDSAKTYMAGGMVLKSGVTLTGTKPVNASSTVLKFNGTSGAFLALTTSDHAGGLAGVTIRDLSIDGNSTASAVIQLGTLNSLIENCVIVNAETSAGYAVQFEGTTNYSGNNVVRGCQIASSYVGIGNGVQVDAYSTSGYICDCQISNCTYAIGLGYAHGWVITDNIIQTSKFHITASGDGYIIARNICLDVGVIVGAAGTGAGIQALTYSTATAPCEIVSNHITSTTINNTSGISVMTMTGTGSNLTIANNILSCSIATTPNTFAINTQTGFTGNILDNIITGYPTNYSSNVEQTAVFRSQIKSDFGGVTQLLRTSAATTYGQVNTHDKQYQISHTNDGVGGSPNGSVTGNIGDVVVRHNDVQSVGQLIYVKTTDSGNTGWYPLLIENDLFSMTGNAERRVRLGGSPPTVDNGAQFTVYNPTYLPATGNSVRMLDSIGANAATSGTGNQVWGRRALVRDTSPSGSGLDYASVSLVDYVGTDTAYYSPMPGSGRTAKTWYERHPGDGMQHWGNGNVTGMTLTSGGNLSVTGTVTAASITAPNFTSTFTDATTSLWRDGTTLAASAGDGTVITARYSQVGKNMTVVLDIDTHSLGSHSLYLSLNGTQFQPASYVTTNKYAYPGVSVSNGTYNSNPRYMYVQSWDATNHRLFFYLGSGNWDHSQWTFNYEVA